MSGRFLLVVVEAETGWMVERCSGAAAGVVAAA